MKIWAASFFLAMAFSAVASTDRKLTSLNGQLVSPADSGDFVFVAAGDNRPTGKGAPIPRVLSVIFGEISLIRPAFVIWSGDTVYGYRDTHEELVAEYDAFVARARAARVPIFNAPGNHEIHGCTADQPEEEFTRRFGNLYGSFDYRGAHFIALDTENCTKPLELTQPETDWLEKDLQANAGARAIFVFFHTEMFQSNNDQEAVSHPPLTSTSKLHALFKKYHVTAVFQGHEHVFNHQRFDGIDYFVTGGAGAPMYANPENQGFSNYVVVQMKGGVPSYTVVEPGHLYAEEGAAGSLQPQPNAWLVNSTNTTLPVAGLEVHVPSSLGTCADIMSEATRDVSCVANGGGLDLTLSLNAPARNSLPIYIRRRP